MIQTPTPMMAQWHECKARSVDALLLFRLGDFYEAFYDDAKLISKELGLTLTQRHGIPMCGVPFHTSDATIDKLIARGHKVAIAEQTETPKDAKGLMKREITRIVTPGTLVHSTLLAEKKNNYIASLLPLGSLFGLAFLDLTTGEFHALEIANEEELIDELYRIKPVEFISPRASQATKRFFQSLSSTYPFLVSERDDAQFDFEFARQRLHAHFRTLSFDSVAVVGAAGALLAYLKDELSLRLDHVVQIHASSPSRYMALDRSTLRNLELIESLDGGSKHTLLDFLDQTTTAMGGRLLCQWLKQPLLSLSEIRERQEAISTLLSHTSSMTHIGEFLGSVRDLERLISRVVSNYATPRDLWLLGHSLTTIPAMKGELAQLPGAFLQGVTLGLRDVTEITHRITSSMHENPPLRISDGLLFQDAAHPELAKLRMQANESSKWVSDYQTRLREETGIKTLKVGYTRAFGYYIEVGRTKGESIPLGFQRSQTLVNTERFITQELKDFEYNVLTAEERAKALEASLFEELRKAVATQSESILAIAKALARLDAILSLALTAQKQRLTCPLVNESDTLHIQGGRHPVIERVIGSAHFIANDTHLDNSRKLLILTGPNMAGKSTYIRQVALIAILAQMGSYVPAESAQIGLIDKVFSRIGASDDLARGQSTFMVEMSETAHILHSATERSLVILDEIGRGTSTYDGISIATSVAEYLLATPGKRAKTLFATHYWELTRLEKDYPTAVNMHVAVEENAKGIVFLRKIVAGGTDRSYGIHVAKLAGLPFAVIERAQELLVLLEEGNSKKTPPPKRVEKMELPSYVRELRTLDINQMSPLQALQKLVEWQKIEKHTTLS
jgi:DNA mismatch repair protein MutS